jgi:transcriptional regulator with XRE-family HTH domain
LTVPVKTQELAERMSRKRAMEGLSLRQAAEKSHVSLGTYYRAEKDPMGVPDLATLLGICGWLGIEVDEVLEKKGESRKRKEAQAQPSTPEVVEAHLRADKKLSPETAKALAAVFKAAYEHFAEQDE